MSTIFDYNELTQPGIPSVPMKAKPARTVRKSPAAREAEKHRLPNIGHVLRERRRELDLTLAEVSDAASITKSFLSDIERNRASPSVATLIRLLEVISLPVGRLFRPAASNVVRSGARPPIKFGGLGVSDSLLSPADAKRLQVILSDIAPRGTGGKKLYSIRSEEEFVFVLSGQIVIQVEDKANTLKKGDAMAFDPRRLHTFYNPSATEAAQVMFVLTPAPL